ncbi:MAG: GNAT family N-acetyltransferase [Propioniciclava sp.]|uniref:GNAT family N-acetyltransferase n=1 Tax=Propioniciclava sp. TaxID=2038686 RepID=UPI0039E3D63E
MRLRRYRSPEDASATYAVFHAAVRISAAECYDPDQIDAWAGPDLDDLTAWDAKRASAFTLVGEDADGVAGFADLLPDGLIDMLFVHPRLGGRGAARHLLEAIIAEARQRGMGSLTTHASRRARPVFERLGFVLVEDRPNNTVRGVVVPNAEMRLLLEQSLGDAVADQRDR